MKKITVPSCAECIYCAQYDNDTAMCSNPEMGIPIVGTMTEQPEVPLDGTFHPDCPLPDDTDIKQILSDFLGVWQGKTGELNKHGEAVIDNFINTLHK